ncbi:hypothetical protein THOM_0509, partial [Trachipleistophora hominis]
VVYCCDRMNSRRWSVWGWAATFAWYWVGNLQQPSLLG